jgi:hypothetical protein
MSHEWNAGVLIKSSWHKLESVEALPDAATMIRRGQETGAWPVSLGLETMTTETGLVVPGQCITADYHSGERRAHRAVSEGYHFLDPKEWAATIEAAVAAGARPAGAFALGSHGGRLVATFEIDSTGRGSGALRNYLNLFDSIDSTLSFGGMGTSIRTVCANTMSMAFAKDGKGAARIRHTRTINDRAELLREAIEAHVKEGAAIADLYAQARETQLHKDDFAQLMDRLFPVPAEDDAKTTKAKRTRALKKRAEAARAASIPCNDEGPTAATLWNAATYLVDRDAEGEFRKVRGSGGALDAMLFGTRGKRVEAIRKVMIDVLRPDGTVESVPADEAAAAGIDHAQIGRSLMDDMLN